MTRREFVCGAVAGGFFAVVPPLAAAYARPLTGPAALVGAGTPESVTVDLAIRAERLAIAGGTGNGMTINGTIPGPLIELYEGHEALLRVTNHLPEDSSIHWHGILLPFRVDGVPGVSFPGIKPGDTFEARFPVRQNGTYWYHSHSGLQEQSGVYGPLVVHPATPERFEYDRDYVVMFSDWTFEDPYRVLANLKKVSDYYNFQRRTATDFVQDVADVGLVDTIRDRLSWGAMRMNPTDVLDVTGYTYTYLLNGVHPDGNWTALFEPGERIRLRFINGSAMTYFNVRIPGLPMTLVAADGPHVQPVEIDEIQIGVAETFDVVIEPQNRAYTIFAESMDRSGYARGTLAPREGMTADVPALRKRPLRTMIDMGMDMGMTMEMDMPAGGKEATGHEQQPDAQHGGHENATPTHPGHRPGMEMGAKRGAGSQHAGMETAGPIVAKHGRDHHGPGNTTVAEVQRDRLGEPGTGLADVDHRVLVYRDLRSLEARAGATKPPDREIELHLTGNMERFMWSFDGVKFSEVDGPIELQYGERVRIVLVNDTMMEHPIHLHGMFMELENGHGARTPLKHTVSVKGGERLAVLVNAVEPGPWAFHCHLLYHMELGMFRVVRVNGGPEPS
ncbi:MAG: copper resistance protein CopA [Proteobacteria bacterium]|nr:MAG: copper resistance protein CopA [Pseudomonadota bacterium]